MVCHLVRNLHGRGGGHCWRKHRRERQEFLQCDAPHCHSWLVYLSPWIFLRLLNGWSRGQHSQSGLQPRRFREQDCILPCYLGFGQEEHGKTLRGVGPMRRFTLRRTFGTKPALQKKFDYHFLLVHLCRTSSFDLPFLVAPSSAARTA